MISLGTMIYLVARKVPQISDAVEEEQPHSKNIFKRIDSFISSLPLEKIDFAVSNFLEKILRKLKLFLMKIDNQLTHHLEKFKTIKDANHKENSKKFALFEKVDNNENVEETEKETLGEYDENKE